MDYTKLLNSLNDRRRKHVKNTMKEARRLASKYGVDADKAELAALFHDIARGKSDAELDDLIDKYGIGEEYKGEANLSHGKIGAKMMATDYGIDDEDVINAVAYHTTGRAGMSNLEKVVFLADAIEPLRQYQGVEEVRRESEISLDRGCLTSLKNTFQYLKHKNKNIDNDTLKAIESLEGR